MSNDRDKFEGQDDSEYHFSDEEVSYEVESDTPKAAPAAGGEQSGGIVNRLTSSRRMLISIAVFLAIVFVAYKVLSPSSSVPSTDITAAPTVAAQTSAMPSNQVVPANNAVQPASVIPVPTAPAPVTATTLPAAPVNQPVAPVAQPVQPPQAIAGQQQGLPTSPAAPVTAMPAVIPVQSAVPAGAQSPLAAMGTIIEEKSQVLSASSQQAMNQLQAQYTQQFNEFSTQNKSLQNQIQSLSSRVTEMQTQINQLVQVLTRRSQNNPGSSMNNPPPPPVQQMRAPEVKVAYNVQAIIPGRAWLKSDNGETLTVAEGDVIRNVGRVTKIDPYDGVVEINTGTKAVSLSYGNGG